MNGKKFNKMLIDYGVSKNKYAEDMGCSLKHVYNLINETYATINWKPTILYFENLRIKNGTH